MLSHYWNNKKVLGRNIEWEWLNKLEGAAVVEGLSSWLLEQEVRGSIPGLATWISEIGYLMLPSRDIDEIPLEPRKSSIQPTNQTNWKMEEIRLSHMTKYLYPQEIQANRKKVAPCRCLDGHIEEPYVGTRP